jgi:16S rRNA (uracil1498-N3)-methyltransferase
VYVSPLTEGVRELSREAAHYLRDVHRLGAGAAFVAFDPEAGLEADASLNEIRRAGVSCSIGPPRRASRGSNGVTLLQALAKGDRLEQVVRAATALGVECVQFIATERTQVRPEALRIDRLRAICVDAARQSGRGDLPRLPGVQSLGRALSGLQADEALKLCLSPRAKSALAERLRDWRFGSKAFVLVGPEGGFSESELEQSRAAGFDHVALGPLTLRTELAAVVVLGCFVAFAPAAPDKL